MNHRSRLLPLALSLLAACGGSHGSPASPKIEPAASARPVASAAPKVEGPTADDAKKFLDGVDKELRRLWVARDRAGWVNQNFITDDTEALAAQGEAATAEYMGRAIPAS